MSRKSIAVLVVLVIGVGAVVLGFSRRSQGQERLREVLAAQAAAGYGSSLRDLVESAPPVDAERQERVWAWMSDRADPSISYAKQLDEAWYFEGATEASAEDSGWAKSLRPVMEELRGILREGPLCLTSLGWIRQDEKRLAARRVSERQVRLPHLLRLREAYRWFAFEAMEADDPAPALQALDALDRALSQPGCLMDTMISVALGAMRDRAYARLALRGNLPEEHLKAWLGEPARATSWMADAWRGERLLYWAPLGHDLVAGEAVGDVLGSRGGVAGWLHGAADCALYLEYLAALEGHQRGSVEVDDLHRLTQRVGRLDYSFITPGTPLAVYGMSVSAGAEHRMIRLGVLVALASKRSGAVPDTDEVAREWLGSRAALLDAGTWEVALTYERLGEKRYRIAVDPKSPMPPILRGSIQAAQMRRSALGKPASTQVLGTTHGSFEHSVL